MHFFIILWLVWVRGGSGVGPGRVRGESGSGPGRVRGGSGTGSWQIRDGHYFLT